MSNETFEPRFPISPKLETDGLLYFSRMCDKIRLHEAGALPEDYHANLGKAMDAWTCRYLGVDYEELRAEVRGGADDRAVLQWARAVGEPRDDFETEIFNRYLSIRGFRDDLAERLKQRKEEAGWAGRDEIQTFFDFIEADEGRA